jgi:hypothetical protein
MYTILWLIAVIMVIAGIYVILARRELLWGIVLIVLGLLVGPGGVSIFSYSSPIDLNPRTALRRLCFA